MEDNVFSDEFPEAYPAIANASKEYGFSMPSDLQTCSLLRALASSKPSGKLLELGTGTGLATSWILDGMDGDSSLTSLDNNAGFLGIARKYLGKDSRLDLVLSDGEAWVNDNLDSKFDFIFADTWHGKYLLLDEVLAMLAKGGLYIVDDMLPQPNWPDGHDKKALDFVKHLERRCDLNITKLNWASGIIIASKR